MLYVTDYSGDHTWHIGETLDIGASKVVEIQADGHVSKVLDMGYEIEEDENQTLLDRLRFANISLQSEEINNDYLEGLLKDVLGYHAGRGQFNVSRMADEGQVLGDLLESLLEEIKEALS